jgi:peptide-methionine (S)-S-oxide reductase
MKKSVKGLLIILGLVFSSCTAKEKRVLKDDLKEPIKIKTNKNMEIATFAGGCFWCTEAVFLELKGVEKVVSGYTAGKIKNPTYREVCSGLTGHAEAVEVYYDSEIINYEILLKVFFSMHNPTTLNRQGGDIGTQYRSAIYYHNPEQKNVADKYVLELENEKVFEDKIVTEISPAETFYPAEDYHQDYYNLNRESNSYCTVVIDPKVNKIRKSYAHLLK